MQTNSVVDKRATASPVPQAKMTALGQFRPVMAEESACSGRLKCLFCQRTGKGGERPCKPAEISYSCGGNHSLRWTSALF
jgi:hypothetical protein